VINFILHHPCLTFTHLILLNLIILITFGQEYIIRISPQYSFSLHWALNVNTCFTDFITVILHLQHVKWDNTGGCPWSPITQAHKIYLSPFFHTEHCPSGAGYFVLTILSKKPPFYLGWHSIPNARVYTSHMALQNCHPLVAFLSDYLGD
jgi:hypothetical protein